MPIDVLMPALSPTMEEGTLAKWHVKQGDSVRSGDVIAEIETDKATMEVEAVDEGVVEEILVAEGTEGVKVNAPIARLSGEGEPTKAAEPEAKAEAPAKEAPKAEPEAKAETPKAQPAKSEEKAAEPKAEASPAKPAAKAEGERIFASPLARRLAEQKGIDLSGVKGSGPHGRIIKADIDAARPGAAPAPKAASAQAPGAAPTAAPAAEHHTLAQLGIPDGSYDLVPLDGMKKTIAKRMTESFRDVPHFPLTVDIELDALLAARTKINAGLEKEGVKVSVNDLVIKATAAALMRVREANASYSPEGIAMHHDADVAMAVAIDGGLITPIIRKAQGKGLAQIATEAKDLAERARARKLKPEEFQG
ncbi:MAG TPA: 2-oxo acid dehydrogenase subunit E2, partial [Phenylobacterium sp.]|nr:2-oxo acid dehydrogenase subunit E2 [Phenylobacterium sp.]